MKVSVIIPNFNNAIYLSECIDSVVNQGFNVVKEIIIVDDHSSDASWHILSKYKKKYPNKIHIFKNSKKGVQSARNLGFEKSTGKYIQWLDSDDVLGPNKISNQLKSLVKKEKNVISFCGFVHFENDTKDLIPKPNIVWRNYNNPIDWLIDSWSGGGMGQTACWLTPRELCEKSFWDEKWIINQDGIYFLEIILKSKTILFTNNAMVYYRKPKITNISRQKSKPVLVSLLKSYKYYEKILKITDTKEIRKALAVNYANFIAYVYPNFKDLQSIAIKDILLLGLKKIPSFGGKRFRILRFFIGLYPAIKLSKKINLYKLKHYENK